MTMRCRAIVKTVAGAGMLAATVLVGQEAGAQLAYAWANEPTSPRYVPAAPYSSVPNGGPVVIHRHDPGSYLVRFERFGGAGQGGGHVIVGAYGDAARACTTARWDHAADGGRHFDVHVRCRDVDGVPADSRFTVLAGWFAAPGAGGDASAGTAATLGAAARLGDRRAVEAVPADDASKGEAPDTTRVPLTLDEIAQLRNAIRELDARVAELEAGP